MIHKLKTILLLPFEDFISALENCIKVFSFTRIFIIIAAFVATWLIYVPIHELAHAIGCIVGGGTVTRLEISPMYGAAFLQKVFPFVAVGSDYAGQLTGFDTHGSDLIYLLTDFFPYLLTVFIGVPLLRSAARSSRIVGSLKLGVAIPLAFAPFISFSGDYYEMGSIIVTRIAKMISGSANYLRLRSDDVFKLAEETFIKGTSYTTADVVVVILSFLLGVVLIYVTYALGALFSNFLFGIIRRKSD